MLTLTAPPPDDLRLPLPAGERPVRTFPAPLPVNTPAWAEGPDGFLLSFLAEDTPAVSVASAVLQRRLTRGLRHSEGLVYHLERTVRPADTRQLSISISADIPREKAGRALAVVRSTLVDLDRHGVTEREVRHEQAVHAEESADPDIAEYRLSERAAEDLLGMVPSSGFDLEGFAALDVAAVSRAFAAMADTLIVVIGADEVDLGLPELTSPEMPPVRGREYRRAVLGSDAPRGAVLIHGPDGVSVRPGPDGTRWRTVLFSDVVGVRLTEVGARDIAFLVSEQGEELPVDRTDWRGASTLLADVLAAVPADLHFRAPPQE